MEDTELLAGRLRDLSARTYQQDYLTHTTFLTASETAVLRTLVMKGTDGDGKNKLSPVPYVIYGGRKDADRNIICFLPSYFDVSTWSETAMAEPDPIACIHVVPANRKFSDELSHRDYLGALMNLGIERDQIGDILCDENEGFIFVLSDMADVIESELLTIKHTTVRCSVVAPSMCTLEPAFKEVTGSVSSERIDAILAMVFHLSRGKAQELVESERVSVDGRVVSSVSYTLKLGERISVRGHGKMIYSGAGPLTKKGRMYASVKQYV